jgi:hypothetical protein
MQVLGLAALLEVASWNYVARLLGFFSSQMTK